MAEKLKAWDRYAGRLAVGCALALALIGGCNANDASELSTDAGKFAGTAARAAGNAQLAGRVNATLAQRKGVDMSGIRVEAEKGVVTVKGSVRNPAEKRRVLDTVEGIRGVDRVIDGLRIGKG